MFGKKKSKKINWKKVSGIINDVADYALMAVNTITIVEGVHSIYKTFRRVDKKITNAEAATAEAKVAEPAAEAAAQA